MSAFFNIDRIRLRSRRRQRRKRHNSDVEADEALGRCAPSGLRSLTPVVMRTVGTSSLYACAMVRAAVGECIHLGPNVLELNVEEQSRHLRHYSVYCLVRGFCHPATQGAFALAPAHVHFSGSSPLLGDLFGMDDEERLTSSPECADPATPPVEGLPPDGEVHTLRHPLKLLQKSRDIRPALAPCDRTLP